jgi:protein SCO1
MGDNVLVMARRCCLLLALLLAGGAHCVAARADGDPASDYLLGQQVFVLSQASQTPTAAQQRLRSAVQSANRNGFQIRVAVIASSYDLGSVTQLWRKPRTYARFLGIELSLAYKGRLLVVMPNGFGFNWPGHSPAAAERALAGVRIRPDGAGVLEAATSAVRRLAAAASVSVTPGSAAKPAGDGGGVALIVGAALALALALGVGLALLRAHTREGVGADPSPAAAAKALTSSAAVNAEQVPASIASVDGSGLARGSRSRASPATASQRPTGAPPRRSKRLRYALPAFATLFVAAASVPVIALSLRRSADRSTPSGAQHQEGGGAGTPFTWPTGQRRAPEFQLADQNGRRVSLASYRGRPVIVTFIDPLCRNLCPLEAHVLNQMDRRLPASQRPEILAVSVDIYADSRKDLLQDYHRWSLVPQWRWAVGKPTRLESVWRRYYAEVEVETKDIAGTTVHYITHSEMAYLIDPRGYERALFVWPFNPGDVERTLSRISRS